MESNDNKLVRSVAAHCKRFDCGRNTAYREMDEGELEYIKIRSRRYITAEQEEKYKKRKEEVSKSAT